ncbi:ComEA family DNA-binding protein [Confluentibacter flavum]|uniref:Competence protein ComEA n=1 Tax=Confluentibacter flavum TaxID=1909700 RepID=A0A2N3HIN1_9FLAO|nr:helix-hairpin-helix domain-containing protein [Confluentibacter flavum]PKQ44811.1 competence protein ComEA [Confluentibacter flavum]
MKSHFTFSKSQRNGIFLLIVTIIVLQCVYFFVDLPSEKVSVNQALLAKYNEEIDSLRLAELEARKPTIYPFNPNYITDYKGASLGMTNEEIDRLLAFRKQNLWINSAKQFQEVTKVSDSLLNTISPYFKFPDWVENPVSKPISTYSNSPKTFAQKQDLNTATAQQLQKVYGIGEALSQRIIKYRSKFMGGFIADVQLQEVYGLNSETIENITKEFTVKTPRPITIINLNKATVEELVTLPYIDYDLAYHITEQRQLREGFKAIDDLTKVKDFPIDKLDIIKLYLSLD